jgi:hypothetical protein
MTNLRAAMVPVLRRWRAYFAPVNRTTEIPVVFDPAHGVFAPDLPPGPWLDLGWVDKLQRTSLTTSDAARGGTRGTAVNLFRGNLEARVEFEFREWGKVQMALASGAQHLNVLATDASATPQASGGLALPAISLLPGSTAKTLQLGAGATDQFAVGDLVAVDVDYQQQIGYVGTGIAAAYVRDPQDVRRDADYVRRVTFNVGRVASKTSSTLLLAQPLAGGAPALGAGAQKVVAFVDREGGSFIQEWSALFVAVEASGGSVAFYYPRLVAFRSGATAGAGKVSGSAEAATPISTGLEVLALRASFLALPAVDGNDGEAALCYRSYFPAREAAVY